MTKKKTWWWLGLLDLLTGTHRRGFGGRQADQTVGTMAGGLVALAAVEVAGPWRGG